MKVKKVDRMRCRQNLDEARRTWEPLLGKDKPDDAYEDEREREYGSQRGPGGGGGFELMESTSPDGDVAKFIEKRGEGVMIISLNVDNTRARSRISRARAIPSYRMREARLLAAP